ncbi:MAG: hypothetical protein IJW82_04480, partial [Clostridia bacterium]|nr:hypothetical protein [Clostridia bacterium]
EDIQITMEDGYSYELYVNNELTTLGNMELVLDPIQGNNICVVVKDSDSKVVAYSTYKVMLELNYGAFYYSTSSTFESSMIVPDNKLEVNSAISDSLYFKYMSYMEDLNIESTLKVNDTIKNQNTAVTLNTGINKVEMILTIEGYKKVKHLGYLYVNDGTKTYLPTSEFVSDYSSYTIQYNDMYLFNIDNEGMTYNINTYNEFDTRKVVVKNYEDVELPVTVTREDNFLFIEFTHTDGTTKLFNVMTLNVLGGHVDSNTQSEIYINDFENNYKKVEFDTNNEANISMHSGEMLAICALNKGVAYEVTGVDYYSGEYVYVEGNVGDVFNITIKVISSDRTASVTYTLNVTIEELKLFSLSYTKVDTTTQEYLLFIENVMYYTGNIKVTNNTKLYEEAHAVDQLANYNLYNANGEAYTSGDKYVKVSMESASSHFKVYKTLDEDSLLTKSKVDCLSDEITDPTNAILELKTNANGYTYYEFYAYMKNSIMKITVYTLTDTQDTTDITLTMNYEGKSSSIDISLLDGVLMSEYSTNGMFLTQDSIELKNGTVNGTTVYLQDGMVFADKEMSQHIGYAYSNGSGTYLVYETLDESIINVDDIITMNKIEEKVNYVCINDEELLNYLYSSSTIDMSITVDGTCTIELASVNNDQIETQAISDLTSFTADLSIIYYETGVFLKITEGTNTYLVHLEASF